MPPQDIPARVSSPVLLIELGGASYDVLIPMAEALRLPNLGRLLQSSALVRLEGGGPWNPVTARATMETGLGPAAHGRFDSHYLDHRRRRVVAWGDATLPGPTLTDVVTEADADVPVRQVLDVASGETIWRRKPTGFEELSLGIAKTKTAIRRALAAAERIDRAGPWRLLRVRFAVFDSLLHRLWHLLGIGDGPGGNRRWVAKTQEAFQTLDGCLGGLLGLAGRRAAAVAVVSPYGFGPFCEKITLSELLRQRDLLHVARGGAMVTYRARRMAWKCRRWVHPQQDRQRPVGGILPIDWRRSRAVTLHGDSAALVYLNTPERFAQRTLTTAAQREQALADAAAALAGARHPSTAEPLFGKIDLVAERFGVDPVRHCLPDVVAVPAAGFCTRHRLDRNRHVMRSDPSLSGIRTEGGLLMVRAPDVQAGRSLTAELHDVAPTVLELLGIPPHAGMTGRALIAFFAPVGVLENSPAIYR